MIAQITYLEAILEHQRGVKVLAMASIFSALFIKNFSAMMNSWELTSSSRQHPDPSLSDRVKRFQLVVRSSMVIKDKGGWKKKKKKNSTVTQDPTKDNKSSHSRCGKNYAILQHQRLTLLFYHIILQHLIYQMFYHTILYIKIIFPTH